jgi:hypothetical protein
MSNQIKAWKKWILNNNWLAGLAINLTVTLLGSVNNLLILIMVLCNLSTCPGYQIKFLEDNGLPTVNQLLISLFPLISKAIATTKFAIQILATLLTTTADNGDLAANIIDLRQVLQASQQAIDQVVIHTPNTNRPMELNTSSLPTLDSNGNASMPVPMHILVTFNDVWNTVALQPTLSSLFLSQMLLSMSFSMLSKSFNCKWGIINNISPLFALLEGWKSCSNGIVLAWRLQCTFSNLEVFVDFDHGFVQPINLSRISD